jgi:hypothetical protein
MKLVRVWIGIETSGWDDGRAAVRECWPRGVISQAEIT